MSEFENLTFNGIPIVFDDDEPKSYLIPIRDAEELERLKAIVGAENVTLVYLDDVMNNGSD